MADVIMKECIENCRKCGDICAETLYNHCLKTGGKHVEPNHVRLMTDCIEICHAAADFMGRGSAFHASLCRACLDICEACASSCEGMGDEVMKKCAEACRRCAASCRAMWEKRMAA